MINDAKVSEAKSIVLYGDSGLGKSTQAAVFAKWIYQNTGKVVRLISAEDSSKTIFEPLMEVGIVDALFLSQHKDPLTMMRRLQAGAWIDKESKWYSYKPGDVGGYIIEGASSIAELLLEDTRDKQRLLQGQDKNVFDENGYSFAPATQMGYGFVQDEMLRAIKRFAGLSGVSRVLWTAHEVNSSDSDKVGIRGPALVGTAKTAVMQKYFGMVIHIDGYHSTKVDPVSKEKVGITTRRLWFQRHPDLQFNNLYYPAKVTIPISRMGTLLTRFPNGYLEPTQTFGIDALLDAEVELASEEVNEIRKWKEEIDKKFKGEK